MKVSRSYHRGQAAFTLIEAMVVVTVVGILATIAVVGYKKYVASAKTGEATHMLGSIKSAQEAFRAETFRYMNVSGNLANVYPQGALSQIDTRKFRWEDGQPTAAATNFKALGITSTSPVRFGYSCVAGTPEDTPPDLLEAESETPSWPDNPGGPWYLAQAIGDLDGDGIRSVFATSSFTAEIWSYREGE